MTGIFDTKKELKKILDSKGFSKLTKIPKQGFTPPLTKWILSNEGMIELEKMVQSDFISSLFDKKHLSEMISSDTVISRNYFRLWVLLILDKWFENNYS